MRELFQRISFYFRYKTGLAKEGIDFTTEGYCSNCIHFSECSEEYEITNHEFPNVTCKRFTGISAV